MNLPSSFKNAARNMFAFHGRAERTEFWPPFLIAVALILAVLLIFSAAQTTAIIILIVVLLSPMVLSLVSRRLHDVGRPLWHVPALIAGTACCFLVLALFAMVVVDVLGTGADSTSAANTSNAIQNVLISILALALSGVLIFWLAKPSDPGPNKYGPNPNEAPT